MQPQTVAVAASFTAEPVKEVLDFWIQETGLALEVKFSPYNQIYQQLLDPSSLLSKNLYGINVVLVRLKDWTRTDTYVLPVVTSPEKESILTNHSRYTLPDRVEIAHYNQYETEYLYQEIFVDQVYLKHGIVLNDGDCVFDVGANIGLFSLFALQKCKNVSLYAFEPAPPVFEILQANTTLYGKNVNLFNCGLADKNMEASFSFFPRSSVLSSYNPDADQDEKALKTVILNRLQQNHTVRKEDSDAFADELLSGWLEPEVVTAQLRTLSSVIREHNIEQIDLLKIDVEKGEWAVLKGISDDDWSIIKQIVIEIHDQKGNLLKEVTNLLREKGFDLVVEEEHLLQNSGLYNIYATRSGQISNASPKKSMPDISNIEQNVRDFIRALKCATEHSATPYLVCICPSPADTVELETLYQRMEEIVASGLGDMRGVTLVKTSELATAYPVSSVYDPYGERAGHMPFTPLFFTSLGTLLARKIYTMRSGPHKVIVLDCDQTLWKGMCGEDGPSGIEIDPPRKALQQFMAAQHDAGMLICLCSKNNEQDVVEVFEHHLEMPLRLNHLVSWRINWRPKSENIKSLAVELQLGLDSFIFIDDNPIECADVQINCPDVLVLQLPEDPRTIAEFLEHIWAFDHSRVTEEDRKRTSLYQQNIQRRQFFEEALSFENFLANLDLEVQISGMATYHLARVSQLTQRTNQFNFTTVRRSEAEIQEFCRSEKSKGFVVEVSDRFGAYGLVGVIMFKTNSEAVIVDTFLLSCRALGRGVEHRMLAQLGEIARGRKLDRVDVIYTPTQKNQPAFDFLNGVMAQLERPAGDGAGRSPALNQTRGVEGNVLFRFPADLITTLTYSPSTVKGRNRPGASATGLPVNRNGSDFTTTMLPAPGQKAKSELYHRIATKLSNTGQIHKVIKLQKRRNRPNLKQDFVAPRTPAEEILVRIWTQVLGLDRVGIYDNFLELGGHSLLAMQVVSRIHEAFQIDMPLHHLFEAPTVVSLAQRIETASQPFHKLQSPSIKKVSHNERIPLSFAQRRLWFLDQLEGKNAIYNLPAAVRLAGSLNVAVLEQCLSEIVGRHEILRTTFAGVDSQPVQVIAPSVTPRLQLLNLRAVPAAERDIEARRLITRETQRPFDLVKGPLARFNLFQLGKEEYVFLVTMHHSVSDAWSIKIFFQELAMLYNAIVAGAPPPLPELPIQYADFAIWQRQWLQGELLETQLNYWKEQLAGAPNLLSLPTGRPRPPVQTFRGSTKYFRLDLSLMKKLEDLSRQSGATLYMILLGAFATLLLLYSGEDDIVVGSSIAKRNRKKTENLIGFFVNTLALRINLAGNPAFPELLTRIRKIALGAYAHQDLPFEKLVDELQPTRNLSHSPLFQVFFGLQESSIDKLELAGLTVHPVEPDIVTAMFDLMLLMEKKEQEIKGAWVYNADIYDSFLMGQMVRHFETILKGITSHPNQQLDNIKLLSKAEEAQQLVVWNATHTSYPKQKTIHQLFEAQAKKRPDNMAVVYQDTHLTYRELNQQANQLAHYLRQQGVGPDTIVALCLDRSLDMVVAILGILKAGGAYLPIDPGYPEERMRFVMEDAGVAYLVTTQNLLNSVFKKTSSLILLDANGDSIAAQPTTVLTHSATPDNLAYCLYTSGSTGKPKGVLIEHRNVVRLMINDKSPFDFSENDVWTLFHSYSFDFSVWEMYGALLHGGKLVVIPKQVVQDTALLLDLLAQERVTVLNQTPTFFNTLAKEAIKRSKADLPLKYVIFGGEALKPIQLRKWHKLYPETELINMYGITETTVHVTFKKITQRDIRVNISNIGKPIPTTSIYIMDSKLRLLPVGVPGEVCVGGAGVGRGYLGRDELTRRKFVSNPYKPEERLYRSGDLARLLPDGEMEYLGRIDDQVQIRGFRVELGEIQTHLLQHPTVTEAVVVAKRLHSNTIELVAYIVPAGDVNVTTLRNHLAQTLPHYMVPSAFVILDALPLTPNGKTDRRALPAPDQIRPMLESAFTPPRTEVEEILARIWAEVLELDQIGIHDNFFELGGHSLLATQVVSRIYDTLQVEIPLRSLFEMPTIAGLAVTVVQNEVRQVQIDPQPGDKNAFPMSFAQQRLWLLDQLEPGAAIYNIPEAVRLTGPLDVAALEQSFSEIIRRHESLRTTFSTVQEQPMQIISSPESFALPLLDLQHLPESEQGEETRRLSSKEAQHPFDLTRGPLLRATLLRLSDTDHVLLLTIHHIIADGWSFGVFYRELSAFYQAFSTGSPPLLPRLPIQYADFSVWQRRWLPGKVLETQLAYWKQQLDDNLPVLELPTDHPRPPAQTFRGKQQSLTLSQSLTESLKALSQQEGATLFMTLLAAFNVLLHRYTGQDDIVVGSPIAGRNRSETERLIGFFLNTLILRANLAGKPTFRELLEQVREAALGAYAHQDLPFEKLVEELHPERDLSRNSLFQVMFILQNVSRQLPKLPGLTVSPLTVDAGTTKLDLTLSMTDQANVLTALMEYNADLFDAATISRMLNHFQLLLEGIVADPNQPVATLPILTPAERHQMLVEWNDTRVSDYSHANSLCRQFEAQVLQTPADVAFYYKGQTLTYQELNRQANQMARCLVSVGVKPGTVVGLCLERSPEAVIGLLGILKAGGAFLPLDPAYPRQQLDFMLTHAQVSALLTKTQYPGNFSCRDAEIICLDRDAENIERFSTENLRIQTGENYPACVIYTSGSTGNPKGIVVPHQQILNRLAWMWDKYPFSGNEVGCQKTALNFVDSIWEIFGPLLQGVPTVIISDETLRDIPDFVATLAEFGVSRLWLVPSLLRAMLKICPNLQDTVPQLKFWVTSGETISGELFEQFNELLPDATLYNLYGTSEVWDVTWYTPVTHVQDLAQIPIGRPIANIKTFILDARLQPLPVGVPGELVVGGAGLAHGYLNQPALTAEKFIPNPFNTTPPGEITATDRLYRTGDLACYLPDGNIQFLGRADHQVKIRGYRVEPGEIETILAEHPTIEENAVIAVDIASDEKQLVAYVAVTPLSKISSEELRAFLKARLPNYLIPSQFVFVESLPLTPNGKTDRLSLPKPGQNQRPANNTFIAPRSPAEVTMSNIWRKALKLEKVSIHDNFFELGGHSLLASQLLFSVRQTFGVKLPLRCIFKAPTIAQLLKIVETAKNSGIAASTNYRERAVRGIF